VYHQWAYEGEGAGRGNVVLPRIRRAEAGKREEHARRNRRGVSLPRKKVERPQVRRPLRFVVAYAAFLVLDATAVAGLTSFFALALAANSCLTLVAMASVSTL
jgi:hypothetical protein